VKLPKFKLEDICVALTAGLLGGYYAPNLPTALLTTVTIIFMLLVMLELVRFYGGGPWP
jgi:hypothetical protein